MGVRGLGVMLGALWVLGVAGPARAELDGGIGAQARPDLGFADARPQRTFHVSPKGDDAHPGTAEQPWRTLGRAVKALGPGDALLVHGGTYRERVDIGATAKHGRPDAPIQVLAAPGEKPVLRGGDARGSFMLRLARDYWVVDGLTVQTAGSQAHGIRFQGARHVVVRNAEVSGGTGPAAVVFYGGASDIGFLRNKVHDYQWGARDSHGLLVLPGSARILIQGNESWGHDGDSFQCQGPDTTPEVGATLPFDITVEDNRFHEDRENAVDLKTCERVTIRGNKFYGYRPAPTAPQGAAMVVHYSARRILIEGNRVWNSGRGLSLGGNLVWKSQPVTDVIVRRNLVFDGTTANKGSGDGLRVGTSRRVRLYHNTLAFLPGAGLKLGDGDSGPAEALEVLNNIIYASPVALDVRRAGVKGLVSERNLAFNPGGDIVWRVDGQRTPLEGWRRQTSQDRASLVADPRFPADPRNQDFVLGPGSPARDRALTLGAASRPLKGSVCGVGPDLGFLESCLDVPDVVVEAVARELDFAPGTPERPREGRRAPAPGPRP